MTDARRYIKAGLTAVTPFLLVPDIPEAIDLYSRLFDAREIRRDPDPAGNVQHAVIRIDDAPIELGRHPEAMGTDGRTLPTVGIHLYVGDVDVVCERAREAGVSATPPTDMPYGD